MKLLFFIRPIFPIVYQFFFLFSSGGKKRQFLHGSEIGPCEGKGLLVNMYIIPFTAKPRLQTSESDRYLYLITTN